MPQAGVPLNRWPDWWEQALRDLTHARHALADGDFEWAARRLDKHYIPARYPNGFASGYPGKLYTRGEAEQAIADATAIIEFCRGHLPR
jgi:HEPN domain-containing protein